MFRQRRGARQPIGGGVPSQFQAILDQLTEREKAMLAALARGRTNTELAAELNISINTVKFHLRNLYEKLDLKNRSQAIAFFYANER